MNLVQRQQRLDGLLAAFQPLWHAQPFRELRPALESLFEDARLGSAASRSALAYLRDFYQLTASQRWVKWRIYGRCLGS